MKLFMVYLGGSAGKSNIEVHDVRFVVGETIEDTYPQLIQEWYGNRKGLHIDCYMQVHHIDGYQIELNTAPVDRQQQPEKLYFVNLGGYQPEQFTELHEFGLFVATSSEDAKQQAKARLLTQSHIPHKDNLFEVDECFPVTLLDDKLHIHLSPKPGGQVIKPDWYGYNVIA